MAEIVLGIGTSHSPLLTFDVAEWLERAGDDMRNPALTLSDGRSVTYEQLLAERGNKYAVESGVEHLSAQAGRANKALEKLADELEAARPDVVVIIGDDQDEFYRAGNTPSLAVFYGEELVMRPLGEIAVNPPAWMRKAIGGYAMDTDHRFACASGFALDLIEGLMDKGVDLGVASKVSDPKLAAFGHAYGFIIHRLFRGRKIPVVPILLNTYYPPNVIRPNRCFDIGKQMAAAIVEMPKDTRVAVVASGGLSHFVTDSELDLQVLTAFQTKNFETLRDLPMSALRAGSSEILCWVMAGGALHDLAVDWVDYTPVYRTPAGSGIGLAFALWK